MPNSGTLTVPPSISGPWLVMPTTPPQVRLPISGPSPAWRNIAGKMSPSEAEFSFDQADHRAVEARRADRCRHVVAAAVVDCQQLRAAAAR